MEDTNVIKALELAAEYKRYTILNRKNLHLEEISKEQVAEQTAYACAIEMAQWKDEQWERNLREFLYRTFYVHPHDCDHICTDDFECKGEFDRFAEEFINRLKDPEQWPE